MCVWIFTIKLRDSDHKEHDRTTHYHLSVSFSSTFFYEKNGPNLSKRNIETNKQRKPVSVTGCFTIPFPSFPFCHFSIILGISVRQALFLKLPLFHRFLYFMISTSSSSVVQTEVEAWGNQAATVTCKPQTGSRGTCKICQFS